jgi:hypothetical protein
MSKLAGGQFVQGGRGLVVVAEYVNDFETPID